MANFTALAAARHARPGRGRLGRGRARPVRRAAAHRDRRRGGAPVAAQGARPARARAPERGARCRWTGRARCAPTPCPRISGPTIVCLQAGNVNTGAFDPFARGLRAGARGRRLGARGRRLRPVGGGGAVARAPGARPGRRRLVGHRRAQVAQRALRQRPGLRARPRAAARGHGRDRRVPAHEHDARALGARAGAVAPRARRRGLGGAAHAGPRRRRRPGRARLPSRGEVRRGPPRRPGTRSSTTSCSTRCWSSSATRSARAA